jgi:hypothetical protein
VHCKFDRRILETENLEALENAGILGSGRVGANVSEGQEAKPFAPSRTHAASARPKLNLPKRSLDAPVGKKCILCRRIVN